MKNLKIIVASALLASFAFGADAKDVAAKSFELSKQASELMQNLAISTMIYSDCSIKRIQKDTFATIYSARYRITNTRG